MTTPTPTPTITSEGLQCVQVRRVKARRDHVGNHLSQVVRCNIELKVSLRCDAPRHHRNAAVERERGRGGGKETERPAVNIVTVAVCGAFCTCPKCTQPIRGGVSIVLCRFATARVRENPPPISTHCVRASRRHHHQPLTARHIVQHGKHLQDGVFCARC